MTPKSKLSPGDYDAMKGLLSWMERERTKDGLVLATVSTIYRLVFAATDAEDGPENAQRLAQDYLPVLRQLGCIEIMQIRDDGLRAQSNTPPKKTIPLFKVTDKQLTKEMWDAYWAEQDPLAVAQARIAELEAALAKALGEQ